MPVEVSQVWAFTSSGVGNAVKVLSGLEFTWYLEAVGASSASIQLQSARSETGPFGNLASTNVGPNACGIVQVTGPYLWVRPYVTSLSGSVTVEVIASGA